MYHAHCLYLAQKTNYGEKTSISEVYSKCTYSVNFVVPIKNTFQPIPYSLASLPCNNSERFFKILPKIQFGKCLNFEIQQKIEKLKYLLRNSAHRPLNG